MNSLFTNNKIILSSNINYNNKKRAAICFSGLLKNYWQTIPNILETLIKCNSDYDIDIFIDVWDKLDVRFVDKYDHINLTQNDIDNLNKLLEANNIKYKEIRIEEYNSFNIDKYKQFINHGDVHSGFSGDHIPSMFYKIKMCNELKSDYESKNNFIYNLVIRARIDIQFNSNIIFNKLDSNIIWIPGNITNIFSDHFAFSSSDNINYYCSLYDRLEFLTNYIKRFNPHLLLLTHMKSKNIKVLNVNNYALRVWGDVVRFLHT